MLADSLDENQNYIRFEVKNVCEDSKSLSSQFCHLSSCLVGDTVVK